MKAVQFNAYGGPEVLRVADVAEPHADAGHVRIAVRVSGVNPSDWKRRAGLYRDFDPVTFPAGVGVEAAGIVDEIGSGVNGVALGDAVFGFGANTAAQHAVLTHWAQKPATMSFEVAGGIAVVTETALRSLDALEVKRGEWLLVSGAAGGVGSAIIQLARLRGIRVIGTAGTQNQDYLRGLGAVPTTYGPNLAERVRTLAPNGINAALDVAGSGIIPELIEITGDPRRVVSIADFTASHYGARFSAGPPTEPAQVLADVARLYADGYFRLHVARSFALEEIADAHAVSAGGHVTGKLIICVV